MSLQYIKSLYWPHVNQYTMEKEINEITMIDAGCAALASGRNVYIVEHPNGKIVIAGNTHPRAIAKVNGNKTFVIINPSYKWAVDPQKIREIHMNRRIAPWPREYKKPQ